jgi:hypothetical protein
MRNQNGQFQKGISGNPHGRPPGGLREIAQSYGPEMLKLLVAKARKGNIIAMCAVLDRGFGKPEVNIDFRVMFEKKLIELTEEELAVLRERMIASSAIAPPVIERHDNEADVGSNVGTENNDAEYSE